MNKLYRRSSFVLSLVAAALALLVSMPAGAFAAGEESSSGSAPQGASGDSTQPAAPPSSEWSPQDSGGGDSSDGAAPLQHGSSVGSGVVPGKAEPKSEAPSPSPESSGSYEPAPSTPSQAPSSSPSPSTYEAPASAPRASRASQAEQPPAPAPKPSRDVVAGVAAADAVAHAAPTQGGEEIDSAPTAAAAASFTESGDDASQGSYALPLLLVILGLAAILGYAYVRLRRHRQRQRLEALWREQDAVWEAALRRAELGQVAGDSEPSAQPLRRIKNAA
ncbi:MAG: hypothetical protein ABW196_04860 [Solirubrobacterales bacterium]